MKLEQLVEQKHLFTEFEKQDNKAKCIQLAIYQMNLISTQKRLNKLLERYHEKVLSITILRQEQIKKNEIKSQINADIEAKRIEISNKQMKIEEIEKENSDLQV